MNLDAQQLADTLDRFYARAQGVPFENSDFQNLFFVVVAQGTPERAYRAICLQLESRLQALREAYFRLQREDLEIERLQDGPAQNKWDRRLAAIDLAEKQLARQQTAKLVSDALHTVQLLEQLLDLFPAYTREAFEAGEREHFQRRLERQQQGLLGAAEGLANMSGDLERLAQQIPGLQALAQQLQLPPAAGQLEQVKEA